MADSSAKPTGRRAGNGRLIAANLPYFLVIGAAFLADRLSKQWAAGLSPEPQPVIPGVLSLVKTLNRGVAFGLLQGFGSIVGWLTIAVLAGFLVYLLRLPRSQWLARVGIALLIGGAAGNLVDRLAVGAVLDFISIHGFPYIFNVADILVNTGAVLMLVGSLRQPPPGPDAGAPEAAAQETGAQDGAAQDGAPSPPPEP